MHVTFSLGLIVFSSYHEYKAFVKNGNVASKHVWKAVKKNKKRKLGYSDLFSC